MEQAPPENQGVATVAKLANVQITHVALKRMVETPTNLPRMGCLYGFSGYGKTTAASYLANKFDAFYIQCQSVWTRKAVVQSILQVMGVTPAKTIPEMTNQVTEELVVTGRPLIIDEMDYIADKGMVPLVMDLYEGSLAPILMLGEERLPGKLAHYEKFHGRIGQWAPAQPASYEDAQELARLYCPEITVADDLLSRIHEVAHGSVRRIAVNLDRVRQQAQDLGRDTMDMKAWGNRELYTGQPPKRRA